MVDNGDYDLVCFTGGTDISPELYNSSRNRKTGYPDRERDQRELDLYRSCRKRDIPMVGICRGAQLLCALSGGRLYQHVTSHGSPHHAEVRRINEKEPDFTETMLVSSSHHQMMNIDGLRDAVLLGSTTNMSEVYEGGDGLERKPEIDVEVVYFPKTKCLSHQPHPEWMDFNAPYRRYFMDTVKELMEA